MMSTHMRQRSQSRGRGRSPSNKRRHKSVAEEDAVEVVCRLTPYRGPHPCLRVSENTVRCVAPPNFSKRDGTAFADKVYEFGHVFDECDGQRAVFQRCAVDLVEDLMKGKNGLLFTYGVTGSGKTYTMTGKPTHDGLGVLPRTLDVLFNSIDNQVNKCVFAPNGRNGFDIRSALEARMERTKLELQSEDISTELTQRYVENTIVPGFCDDYVCSVFVSYVEIFNNYCYDLLEDKEELSKKDIRTDASGNLYVGNAVEKEVEDSNEALTVFCAGEERRSTANTLLNKDSSRSHSVFTIRLVQAPFRDASQNVMPDPDSRKIVVSQLALVDLAGSERAKRTLNTGSRLAEASNINKSLMVLRQCIDKLRRNQHSRAQQSVPYRDSKLTYLFKNYFEGRGRIRMIICANPKPDDFEENLNVLSFAEESQAVRVARGEEQLVEQDENRPAVPRRFYSKWCFEMDRAVSRMDANEYDNDDYTPPNFVIADVGDENAVPRLRQRIVAKFEKEESEMEDQDRALSTFESLLRTRLCVADYKERELERVQAELDRDRNAMQTLRAQLKQVKRESESLRERLSRYEQEDEDMVARQEHLRKSQHEERKRNQQKTQTLKAVYEIATSTTPASSVAQLKQKFDANAMTSSTPDFKRLEQGGSEESRSVARKRDMATPRNGGPGYYNPKYQRRSKSAPRMLVHQGINRVPTGGIMGAKLPPQPRSKKVTKPEVNQLHQSTDYVLEHQEVDQEGNISTSMYKRTLNRSGRRNESVHSRMYEGTCTFSDDHSGQPDEDDERLL